MEQSIFHPGQTQSGDDEVAKKLKSTAQAVLVLVTGLSPLLFIPTPFLSLSFGKVLIVLLGLAIALLLYSLSMLRDGSFTFRLPVILVTAWLVAATTVVSALLSGDIRDALFGNSLEGYTAGFVLIMVAIITVSGILQDSKKSVLRLYGLLVISALILTAFHLLRILFGPDFLTLGLFNGAVATPLGSWNGLAIFYGLTVLLSLVSIAQLSLNQMARWIVAVVLVGALIMLAIINFYPVFVILAIVSFILLIYSVARGRWLGKQLPLGLEASNSVWLIVLSLLVLIVSGTFLATGDSIGASIAERTNISFVEVRPSLSATIEITERVYSDNLFFSIGPNRFVDAWRLHKDPAINETIFWNTNFEAGHSYLLTSFVNGGILVALSWLAFLGAILWSGYRLLFHTNNNDRFWYFIGLSSLICTLYFWGISLIYVPPVPIMLLAAICTGVYVSAYIHLLPGRTYEISIARHRNYGFVLITLVMLIIVGASSALYFTSKQALANYQFNNAIATIAPGDTLSDLEVKIMAAFAEANNDVFLRQLAIYQLSQMEAIIGLPEPSEAEQQIFQESVQRGTAAGLTAVDLDETDPQNWLVLGRVYSILSLVGVSEAKTRAEEAYQNARQYDPYNPTILLLEAQLALQNNELDRGRELAEEAARLQPLSTDALFLLSQIEIAAGSVDQAILRTREIIQLEPQNPARRYQLGILLSSVPDIDGAITAFEQAVELDPQYANARYFLALGYVEKGEIALAIEQLQVVSELNPDNQEIKNLISDLESGNIPTATVDDSEPVAEAEAGDSGQVSEEDLESDLVTSPNPPISETSDGVDNSAASLEDDTETAE